MPTLLRWNGYRFFFYSADGWEPAHVHVEKSGCQAKIWLGNLGIAINLGYSPKEMNEIVRKTRASRELFQEAWNDYFANRN